MSKQEWFFVAIVVVVTLAGFGIIEQLRKIASSLDVIARTTGHWHEQWNKQYGPPEPRYPT